MAQYDVFNGDADGLCALQQLRLAAPAADALLVTGVKRDIALLRRVEAGAGDRVSVLDISAHVNHDALVLMLARGAQVEYFDHHFAGDLPVHANLRAHIDPSARTCTSLIVDRHLEGRYRAWAVAGAFGDNLANEALALAHGLGVGDPDIALLRELGEDLAYNSYADRESDLVVHPAELSRALRRYADPLRFVREAPERGRIAEQKRADLQCAMQAEPAFASRGATIYVLPDEPWVRRARGLFAYALANGTPAIAHAVVTPHVEGGYTVSVRAPLARPDGADALCRKFATGGGRRAAAGINRLAPEDLQRFVDEMDRAFPGDDPRVRDRGDG